MGGNKESQCNQSIKLHNNKLCLANFIITKCAFYGGGGVKRKCSFKNGLLQERKSKVEKGDLIFKINSCYFLFF